MSLKTILKNFLNHVDTLETQRKLGNDLYETDFQKLKGLTEQLKHDEDYATSEGLRDVNRRKNRYKDILPYDCSRVILSDYPGVPGSDFINANYIKGASGSLAYIASQGPLPNTVVDFWRMIWECEVQVIVMACNEQESGKYKCECYWPGDDDKKQYGNINVELVKWRQVCPDFLVRTLKASWENEERVLCQFHYTTWPDHGVPTSVQPILELVRLIRDCQASEAVPVLIHCSAGCGRTGTICAIDYVWGLMRMGKLTKSFNLYNVISDMRRQRIAMVQTKEQYVLVHKAVASLFEQQLRVIDSHTYENLDEDGEPLVFKELQPEEVLYEDILEPEAYRLPGETNIALFKTLGYGSRTLDHSILLPPEKPRRLSPCQNLNSATSVNALQHMDQSIVLPHDYQATAIAQEILSDLDFKDEVPPNSRNSTILLKLRREESVKRLISGWNKASQQQQHSDTSSDYDKKSDVSKTKSDFDDLVNVKFTNIHGDKSPVSVQEKCLQDNEDYSSNSCFQKTKRTSSDESHHSGKLVGKATVIRRPSIAKLKALFEKSAPSNSERHAEEPSRRRRPLFRSHSHYVGHSRNFSVPDNELDGDHSPTSYMEEQVSQPARQAVSSSHLDTMNYSNSHSSSTLRNSSQAACRGPSPDKYSQGDSFDNLNKSGVSYMCQNSNCIKPKHEENSRKYLNSSINSDETGYPDGHFAKSEESSSKNVKEESASQQIVPVHQRIKQYSSIVNDKPPLLPSKKRSSSRECCKSRERVQEKNVIMTTDDSSEVVIQNDAYKLVISKSDNYFTPPNNKIVPSNDIDIKVQGLNESENAKAKALLYSETRDTLHTTMLDKGSPPEVTDKNTSLKIRLNDGKRKEGLNIYLTTSKQAAPDPLYGHIKPILNHTDDDDDNNKMCMKTTPLIEEKFLNYSHVDPPVSCTSYIGDSHSIHERPPMFMSSNQPVKLSQPMESHELKPPDKIKEQSGSHVSRSKSPNQSHRTVPNAVKHSKDKMSPSDAKNLLLHSPPPKSKRNHSSKNAHRERSNSIELLEGPKISKKSSNTKESHQSSKSEKTSATRTLSSPYEPASRSDPRYFPVTRQTPEDARYASEKQKTLSTKKSEVPKYETHEGFYSTPFPQKDSKTSTYQYLPPHKKSIHDALEVSAKRPLSKAYVPHAYKQYDPKHVWPSKVNEPIYSSSPTDADHHTLRAKHDVSSSSKELSSKLHSYTPNNNNTMRMQHSRNASAPASYDAGARENLYGTTKQSGTPPQTSYPPGPPKPPRTFNHKFKYFNKELDSANQEKSKHSMGEGGRFIVSVASPKQSADINEQNHNTEHPYFTNIPKHHMQYPASNDRLMSRSYPFPASEPSSVAKVPEVAEYNAFHSKPSDEHIYSTIRDKSDPSSHNSSNVKKYADYENMFDAQRDYLDAMANRNPSMYNYTPNQNATSPSGIQYSQSDASIYAVMQNQKPVKSPSSWQHDANVSTMSHPDATSVPKRVYFDTLQRRHKQHVSWEQRRSHDDMDIRPAPSARLKEQIHARRSLVDLDNLEISIAGDNGFHEQNLLDHSILSRKDFAQESTSSHGRFPAELSESLISKDVYPRKNQTHSKEIGSFGGTLYKAFGKLTALTKFNSKESASKNLPEDNSPKAPPPKEEKPDASQWTQRKPKDHAEPSEQWTEV